MTHNQHTDEDFSALLEEFFNSTSTKEPPLDKNKNNYSLTTEPPPQKDLPPCGIGEFIGVICSSYAAGDLENYAPYPQVWFSDEEAAEKCKERGYQITTEQARKFLGQILERSYELIEYRDKITIGRREYRRVKLLRESAKKYFRIEAPYLKIDGLKNDGEYKPPQEYRTRYGRNDNHHDR